MNIKAFLLIMIILSQVLVACGSNGFAAAAVSTPTAMPTPTTDPMQSAKIVQAFWDALEAGDLETAMVYVADDVSCTGFCYFHGKETFRSYLQGYLDAGFTTKISDIRNVGSIVTYSWAVYRNGNFVRGGDNDEIMHVENGKIVYWENQHH
jgi:limonene-1,2-epoxide hydrolase